MALRGKTAASRFLAHGQIVFCVQSDDLAAGRSDTRAAAGLGQVLADQGHAVAIVGQESWHRLPVGALVVSVSPTFDPAWVPRDVPVVAWVCDQADAWAELRQLSHFDAILVSSHASAEGLAKTFAGRVGVLPIGIDSSLFRPHPVNRPADTVVALGAVKGASYFTLPDLYQRALVVVDDVGSTDTPFGTRISRLLETAACGAIPVIAHHDELADAMLEEVQVYQSAHEIDRMVRELRADPVATMATGSRLAAQVREVHSWERRASTFLTEVEPLLTRPNGSHPAPRSATLGFFPDYRHGNPYQSMLYADLTARDVVVAPVDVPNVLVPRDPGGRLEHYVLHLHWTTPLLQFQPGPFGAELALRRFRHRLGEFRDRGGRLVWTIHNVLPHECPNPAAEIQLCRFLAAHADMVHVMGGDTAQIVAPLYELPADRTVVIPHSSYVGVYPDVVSREEARSQLHLHEQEIVLLMLGAIRPYKGLGVLLDVFDEMSRVDPRLRLLVVGQPSRDPACALWKERCEKHPRIVAHFAHADEADLQVWCRAADLAVLPYVSILNSGWFQLALTFDLPVVGSCDGSLGALLDPAFSESFAPGSAGDLRLALETAVRRLVGRPEVQHAARAAARKYLPDAMAHDFANAVMPLFD